MNSFKNNKGAVVELVLLLVVGLLILGALYVYSTKSSTDDSSTVKITQAPKAGEQTDLGSVTNPTVTPTPLPEVSDIPTNSGDADIDSAAKEVNTLMDDVDKLDDTSNDLDGLNPDFSVNF